MKTVESTYKQHVIQRTYASLVPNFDVLFGGHGTWPSLKDARTYYYERIECIKTDTDRAYRSFVEMFLGDPDSYMVGRKMWTVGRLFEEKNSKAFQQLYDLRIELMQRPTMLPLFPEGLLNVLRAAERPKRRSSWGLIQITKRHKLSCSVCVKLFDDECYRARCLCNPFGSLLHYGCIGEKKCTVCSSQRAISKVAKKRKIQDTATREDSFVHAIKP